jgi:hypothetical protein
MCPACIASVGLMAGSVMSAGGFTALAAKLFRPRNILKTRVLSNQTQGRNDDGYRDEQKGSFESRTAC